MDISDGGYPSILKSDIRLIYFSYPYMLLQVKKEKKKKTRTDG
jgi:hypothetical protein